MGTWVQSLVGELRSHYAMWFSKKTKKKIIKHGSRGIVLFCSFSFLFLTDCVSEVTAFGLLVDGEMRRG